uniref:Uncharacterized protein n=1 Tax=Eutreptiella gymnastica TaxID=73025 RepID=A0A7S4LC62_9EUGL
MKQPAVHLSGSPTVAEGTVYVLSVASPFASEEWLDQCIDPFAPRIRGVYVRPDIKFIRCGPLLYIPLCPQYRKKDVHKHTCSAKHNLPLTHTCPADNKAQAQGWHWVNSSPL